MPQFLGAASRIRLLATVPSVPQVGHYPNWTRSIVPQFDQHTGEEISPFYFVPTNPSLINTPPGVPDTVVSARFYDSYSRMVPLVANQNRDHVYGKFVRSVIGTSTDEFYSQVSYSLIHIYFISPTRLQSRSKQNMRLVHLLLTLTSII